VGIMQDLKDGDYKKGSSPESVGKNTKN